MPWGNITNAKQGKPKKNEAAVKPADSAIARRLDEADAELKRQKTPLFRKFERGSRKATQGDCRDVFPSKFSRLNCKKGGQAAFLKRLLEGDRRMPI